MALPFFGLLADWEIGAAAPIFIFRYLRAEI